MQNDVLYQALILYYTNPGYERVYLPLYKVADTPFNIQGNDLLTKLLFYNTTSERLCKHLVWFALHRRTM